MPSTKRVRGTSRSKTKKSPPTSRRSSPAEPPDSPDSPDLPDAAAKAPAFRLPTIRAASAHVDDATLGEDDAPRAFADYEDRYVAFIDILGFKALIEQSARSAPSHAHHASVAAIFAALDIDFRGFQRDFEGPESLNRMSDLRVHTFSDFVVASCHASDVGLALLAFVTWRISSDWLSKRYLSRGAITRGKVVHRAEDAGSRSPLVFGPAFIEAYVLESQVADMPRIMLSKAVRRDWLQLPSSATPALQDVGKLVTRCPDGPSCIDTFAHLRRHGYRFLGDDQREEARQFSKALEHHLDEAADVPARYRKTRWLADRFNAAIVQTPYADLKVQMEGD